LEPRLAVYVGEAMSIIAPLVAPGVALPEGLTDFALATAIGTSPRNVT